MYNKTTLAVIAVLAVTGLAVVMFRSRTATPQAAAVLQQAPPAPTGDTPTPEPTDSPSQIAARLFDPIETEQEAISRTLETLPPGITPTDLVVKLVRHSKAEELVIAFDTAPNSIPVLTPMPNDSPSWVVGLLADDLTRAMVAPQFIADEDDIAVSQSSLPTPGAGTPAWELDWEHTTPIDGLISIWDANSGREQLRQNLSNEEFLDISVLQNESLTIALATVVVIYKSGATATPGPQPQ